MSSSKCIVMHDDDNSSTKSMIIMHYDMHDDKVHHGYGSNSKSLPKGDHGSYDLAPSASSDGDGDDDDDGGYDFAPAA
ncbi:hypothetical protein CCACVL1_12700 [Corchorus capsularis]|uniref:Uncharacterized protein n=1 Tax=Corchorus capsularis TaxID=210143 RepID=A0A1R3IED2_COCAP|nr:hypothetical protein CCACVL1_12700 [Corchorus capsularis]